MVGPNYGTPEDGGEDGSGKVGFTKSTLDKLHK